MGESFFFFFNFSHLTFSALISIYLFIYYFWLCWVFVSVRGPSLVAASGGHSSSRCAGLSLSRPLLLRSTSSRRAGSVTVAHGPSRSAACGILPDQGSNPCPLHWQADSQPLRHQGSPWIGGILKVFNTPTLSQKFQNHTFQCCITCMFSLKSRERKEILCWQWTLLLQARPPPYQGYQCTLLYG